MRCRHRDVCERCSRCHECGDQVRLPSAALLQPFVGESQAEYAARQRREWHRETRRPRRPGRDQEQMDEDVYTVLGVR